MPVPTSITDLSTTASSNPPAGSETPQEGDNHLRAAYSFIRQISDRFDGTSPANATVNNLTVNGVPSGNLLGSLYTPTLTEITNFGGAHSSAAKYLRIGSYIAVFGISTGTTSVSGIAQFRVSLPVASAFTAGSDCIGIAAGNSGVIRVPGDVTAHISADEAEVSIHQTSGSATWTVTYVFLYRVQ